MRAERGEVISKLAGKVTITGTVGIRLLTPTPPAVAKGTMGSVGAGRREATVVVTGI